MADGHLNKCIECTKKDVQKHRSENLDAIREYDRKRGMLPHRVNARIVYQKTKNGKDAVSLAHKNYYENYPDRRHASIKMRKAVRNGLVTPWPGCFVPDCDGGKIEGHHPDYSAPLSVVWLCAKHHKEAHKLFRELTRNSL
jgi:hypothetical protein